MSSVSRSRWAAIGAAVAVTLGAGGIGISHATTDSADGAVSAFFPIEPCRLADNAAIAADSSITLDGWGTSGACELPNDITGLAANVTAVGATQQTNLRLYAGGADVPDTANLNPSPGSAPTPNAVNITLNDTTGEFSVYNRFGTVSVFIDVMGYYDDHTHDDRYYTEAEVDAALAGKADAGDVPDPDSTPFMVISDADNAAFDGTDTVVQSLDVEAPSAGSVLVNYNLIVSGDDGDRAVCNVGTGVAYEDAAGASSGDTSQANGRTNLAGTRVFEVAAGSTTFNLVCFVFGDTDTESAFSPTITALFTPATD